MYTQNLFIPDTIEYSKETQTSTSAKTISIKIANVGICREIEMFFWWGCSWDNKILQVHQKWKKTTTVSAVLRFWVSEGYGQVNTVLQFLQKHIDL